jgi:hypothetical protein
MSYVRDSIVTSGPTNDPFFEAMRQLFKYGLSFSLEPLLLKPSNTLIQNDILSFWDSLIEYLEGLIAANKPENSPHSQFLNLFNGKTVDVIRCNHCGQRSINEKTKWKSLTFNENQNFTDSIKNLESKINISNHPCNNCKNIVNAEKQTVIDKLPPYLVIGESKRSKDKFQEELNIKDYYDRNKIFKLFAIIAQTEDEHGKRFFSYTNYHKWWRYDRNTIKETSIDQIIKDDGENLMVFIYASTELVPAFPPNLSPELLRFFPPYPSHELFGLIQRYPPDDPPEWFWTFQPYLYSRLIQQSGSPPSYYYQKLTVRQSIINRSDRIVWPTCTYCEEINPETALFSRLCNRCHKAN